MEYSISNVLSQAEELECTSVSLPAISTGSLGFPKKKCAQILFQTVINFLSSNPKHLKEVRFINIDERAVNEFVREFDQQFTSEEVTDK